ncbi:MAG: HD domain-containing protein [Lachnospiraceae bacterium]|nr:HD domain-containing protein [Lachnospiraceae bacterium]
MMTTFYGILFLISVLLTAWYLLIWHRNFDTNITMVFVLVPIACLGYFFFSRSRGLGEALAYQRMIYLSGCYLSLFIFLSILDICKIRINRWLRMGLFLMSTVIYASVLTIGIRTWYYKKVSFVMTGAGPVLRKTYGFMHTVYYVEILAFFAAGLWVIFRSWKKRRQVPRSLLLLVVFPESLSVAMFLIVKILQAPFDVYPVGYVLALVLYLIISNRISLYHVNETVIDSMVREREIGYVSLDFKYRYLGSNHMAKVLMPQLQELAVDEKLGHPGERMPGCHRDADKLWHYLEEFREDPRKNTFVFTLHGEGQEERFFNVNVNYLYNGSRKVGYLVTFTDDTANRRYIRLLDHYNEELQSQVEQKTEHIVRMHDNLIMSLAMMVESRDNSTGGHIKRTSEGVRILVEEIQKEGRMSLSEEFCRDVIKAAPMHDLGKIAVDDAILRKPGRFTEEEYEKMKEHAAEGAKVIHRILLDTEDVSFKTVAENVAHYHHERWDGCGYPEGKRGEEIPFEARIMAVADVYDALVSKRVYKEAFDFEKANAIILEGMGSQFDPDLAEVYRKARPRLEAFYLRLR